MSEISVSFFMSDDRCQRGLRYDTKNGRVVLVMVISQLRACLYIDEVNLLARLAGLARLMPPFLLRVFVVSYISYLDFFLLRTPYPDTKGFSSVSRIANNNTKINVR